VIPVNDASKEYAKKVYEQLQNFDVEMEDTDATLGKRIRKGELLHFNYILTIGAKECE
jgi:threonyl-tRNA synthetase